MAELGLKPPPRLQLAQVLEDSQQVSLRSGPDQVRGKAGQDGTLTKGFPGQGPGSYLSLPS